MLGIDPATGKQVTLRNGPYGLYVQLGEAEGKEKPKRASLLKGMTPDERHLEKALAMLSLPRELGPHPEDGEPILAGVGRFGPYVKHGSQVQVDPGRRERARDRHEPRRGAAGRGQGVGPRPRRQAAAHGRQPSRPTRRRSSSTKAATAIT